MRTWTLAFVLVTTLTVLALRLDDPAWLQGAARIGFGLGVALALAYGLRSFGLKLSAYEAALPRHPRTRAPADPPFRRSPPVARAATRPHVDP